MRVLLDEQLDRRLGTPFDASFSVRTGAELGWASLPDGELLRSAERESDVRVTMDRGIPHPQNLKGLSPGVVLVRAASNRRADVAPLIPLVNEALRRVRPGELIQAGGRRAHAATRTEPGGVLRPLPFPNPPAGGIFRAQHTTRRAVYRCIQSTAPSRCGAHR